MKKSKRLILFVMAMMLVVSMAFGGIITVNAAESGTEYDNTYRVGLLEALKISKVSGIGVSEWTGNLTRGEAAFLVAGLIQLERSKQETIFDDVSIDAYYAGSVASLNQAGVILKSWGSRKFKPDEPIEYGEFLTMLCKALGYAGYAESQGGYPIGYVTVAKQFKLTKGVNLNVSSTLDKKYVPKLLMNALDANYLGVSEIDREGNTATEKRGVVLNDYFDIYKESGILKEVGPFSANNNFVTDENQMVVGDYIFNFSGAALDYYDLLGQQVTVYYKETNSTVYVYPDEDNNVLTIDAADLQNQSTVDVIKYYDAEGDDAKAKLAGGHTIIYNGTKDDGASLNPTYGNLTLVDNNGDNKYDIVKVASYELAEVESVDSYNKTITFAPITGTDDVFVLDTADTGIYKITGTNGKNLKATAIAKGDIVLYAKNNPRYAENLYYNFIVSKSSVKGSITAIGSEEIEVSGTSYEFSSLLGDITAAMGDDVTVHVDAAGKVLYIEAEGYNYKDAKYAIFLSFDQIRGGSKPQWEIELFTQDGAKVYLPVAEKVRINGGNKAEIKDPVTRAAFAIEPETMIKYNASNGEFTELYTADDWGTSYKPWDIGKGFNRYQAGSKNWRTYSGGMFNCWLGLASDAIRFYIAHDDQGKFDEERSQVSTARFQNDQTVSNIVVWDIDKAGKAHAYMASPQYEVISTGSGSNQRAFLAVTKVIDGTDTDGVPGKYVFGMMGGSEKQYWLSSENYDECGIAGSDNPFVVGNLVKIRTTGNDIVGIMKTGKNTGTPMYYTKADLEDPDVDSAILGYDFANPNVRLGFTMIAKVLYVQEGMVYLVRSDSAADATSDTKSFVYPTGGTVYKFDAEGEDMLNVVTWNDVRPSTGVDSADDELNGSTVLVNVQDYSLVEVVILD